jgi:alkylation response protein AidB-like acyl-CoA dehydrogenase
VRFDLSPDQRLLQSATADLLDKFGAITLSRALQESGTPVDPKLWRQGAELGWTSLLVPEDAGGGSVSGRGLVDAAIIAEQLGRVAAPGPFLPVNVVAAALTEAPAAEQHSSLVTGIMAGTVVAACAGSALDERVGVDATSAHDGFVLSGVHAGVEAAPDADTFVVLAQSATGPAQFVVPADAPGVSVTRARSLDLVRSFGTVTLAEVRVPATARVGGEGDVTSALERQLQIAAVLQCAHLAGVVERVLEITEQWMGDRYTFGRPLNSYQALKHRFADMTMWSHTAQGLTAAAADAVQDRRANAAELASAAKVYLGQRATDIIQDCVQMHGGIGVTWEHDLHIYLRRATVDRQTWGTPADHRRRIVNLLGI